MKIRRDKLLGEINSKGLANTDLPALAKILGFTFDRNASHFFVYTHPKLGELKVGHKTAGGHPDATTRALLVAALNLIAPEEPKTTAPKKNGNDASVPHVAPTEIRSALARLVEIKAALDGDQKIPPDVDEVRSLMTKAGFTYEKGDKMTSPDSQLAITFGRKVGKVSPENLQHIMNAVGDALYGAWEREAPGEQYRPTGEVREAEGTPANGHGAAPQRARK